MIDRDVSLKLSRGSLLKSGVAIGTFFAAAGAATVAGCTPPPKSSIGGLRFEFIVKTVNSDYWQACLEGGKAASQQFGLQALQFTGADSETNIQRQIELVEEEEADGQNGGNGDDWHYQPVKADAGSLHRDDLAVAAALVLLLIEAILGIAQSIVEVRPSNQPGDEQEKDHGFSPSA